MKKKEKGGRNCFRRRRGLRQAVVRYVRAPLTEDREALQGLREGVPVEEGRWVIGVLARELSGRQGARVSFVKSLPSHGLDLPPVK